MKLFQMPVLVNKDLLALQNGSLQLVTKFLAKADAQLENFEAINNVLVDQVSQKFQKAILKHFQTETNSDQNV